MGGSGMHVRREHLRLMDQHLMGSRTPPPFPQKGYIHSGARVGGCKTAAMSFDGDGIHR